MTQTERQLDSLVNAWGCSFGLLFGILVLSGILPIATFTANVGAIFLRWDGLLQLLIVLSVPFLMVWTKTALPRIYGGIEVVVGGLITVLALDKLHTDGTGVAWISLFAAMYWMSRGAQNLRDGFTTHGEEMQAARVAEPNRP